MKFSFAGKFCSICATLKMIEVFINGERIAAHPRNYNAAKRYTSLPEHMPESHKSVIGWNDDRLLDWAQNVGPNTKALIETVLSSREYHIQTYRACLGIMRFSKIHSNEIMEVASQESLAINTFLYKYFSILIKQVSTKFLAKKPEKILEHKNVRGYSAFVRGGINA